MLMAQYPLRMDYSLVLTDLLRMKPVAFRAPRITARHLAASCALPGFLPQCKIDGRWYSDGGLLNPLPAWAAVEYGATHIIALHAGLPILPLLFRPFVYSFRAVFGYNPPLPSGVEAITIRPPQSLGSLSEMMHWKRENAALWLERGRQAAKNISLPICFQR